MHNDGLTLSLFKQHSLRKQDVELMSQLLALNSSIQEFKSTSNSSSISNFSDISDAETEIMEIESKPAASHAWYQPESSGSDSSSVLETRGRQFRPDARFYNRAGCANHDGLNSEVIWYYSNASARDSIGGSNPSLTGYDVNAYDYDCSPQSVSPVSSEPPFQYALHSRQRAWLNQEYLVSNGRAGSDLTLYREFPENGGVLHPPVQSRAFFQGDEKVRKLIDQKRNTTIGTQSPIGSLFHNASDHSLNSDNNGPMSSQTISSRLWQRSQSNCALNRGCRTPSPVLNTIKVDLRNNPPMAGTAIELILPISPLKPTRRSSAVRMAERRPLSKLNTLNKRQSMIW